MLRTLPHRSSETWGRYFFQKKNQKGKMPLSWRRCWWTSRCRGTQKRSRHLGFVLKLFKDAPAQIADENTHTHCDNTDLVLSWWWCLLFVPTETKNNQPLYTPFRYTRCNRLLTRILTHTLSFFVSARTNKRHHRQLGTQLHTVTEQLSTTQLHNHFFFGVRRRWTCSYFALSWLD